MCVERLARNQGMGRAWQRVDKRGVEKTEESEEESEIGEATRRDRSMAES